MRHRFAQEDYDDAVEKLNEFDAVLGEQTVNSEYNGVVTEISLARRGYGGYGDGPGRF